MAEIGTKEKFAFDVGWVFASLIAVLILHFIQTPLLARLLGPDGLGLYIMVILVATFIELVAGLGIDAAIVKYVAERKENKGTLYPLVSSALVTMIAFGIMSSLILFVLSDTVATIFNMPLLSPLLKIYAFVFPFSLMYWIIISFFNGLREMKYYAFINILQAFLIFSFIITFLLIGFGVEGAVFGTMIAIIVTASIATIIMRKFMHFTIFNYKRNIKTLASFGSRLMLGNTINMIVFQADILIIGYFLTTADVGIYSVAVSLSRFFLRFPEAIQRVSYPATSEYWTKNNHKALNKMVDKSMKYSVCFLLVAGVGLYFFAKDIILFLFGQAFISALLPFQILIIGTVIFGVFKSIGDVLPGIGRPDLTLKINATSACINLMLNVLLVQHFGIAGAAVATTISFIMITVLSIYSIVKITKINIDSKWYTSAFTITLLAIAAFSACSKWINPYLLGSLILSVYIAAFFAFFLTKEDKETLIGLIRSIICRRSN